MPRATGAGPVRMRALAAALPAHLRDGFEHGREVSLPAEAGSADVVVTGMGGSGVAAELARGVLEAETRIALTTSRGPTPPAFLSRESRVVLVSYSGTTWETLRAYEAAGRARSSRIVLTSGGTLAERAVRDGVPLLPIPAGLPPRSAVGYLLGGLLGVLDPWFPESNEGRLRGVCERLRTSMASFARRNGLADRIAASIGPRFPFVYAEGSFVGLARRWKTQIEENAKRLAAFDEVPELLHNALVGWDALSRVEGRRSAALLLEWSGTQPLFRQSVRYLERLLLARGVTALRVPLPSEDRLEALVYGLSLGDHVSLSLAERRKVDPLPVEAISRLKNALGSVAAPESAP